MSLAGASRARSGLDLGLHQLYFVDDTSDIQPFDKQAAPVALTHRMFGTFAEPALKSPSSTFVQPDRLEVRLLVDQGILRKTTPDTYSVSSHWLPILAVRQSNAAADRSPLFADPQEAEGRSA